MFEGWASDLLASYLGQFLEVQREQLRISLWSAWRTGLTMQNVAFRPGAFDHMQLPFKLSHGQIGTLQIHVPWRALRSPVVIDLTNVELTLSLLTLEDLTPEASAERAWAVKQAHLAAQELQELAAGVSSDSDGKPPPEAKQGGMLWSLVQHAVTMLLRRLQLSVTNVHIRVVDPATGRCFGFKLGKLHTCLPGETEHPSILLAEDAGVAAHSSAAARGSIQKQIAAEGIQFYWKVGGHSLIDRSSSSPLEQESPRLEQEEERIGSDSLPLPPSPSPPGLLPQALEKSEEDWNVLHSTDIVLHVTSKLVGSGRTDPITIHASAAVHSIPIAVRPCQIQDILFCLDQMNWISARAHHAHLRPLLENQQQQEQEQGSDGTADVLSSSRNWKAMWQYAVNAVLADIQGPLKAAPWRPPSQVQHDRRQYVLLYRKKLEAEREVEKKTEEVAAVAAVSGSRQPALAETTPPPEAGAGEITIPEQQQVNGSSSSAVPIRIGLSPVGEKRLLEFEKQLCVEDILRCRSAAAHSFDGTSDLPGGKKGSTSEEESAGGGVFWGLAKAASFVGYGGGGSSSGSGSLNSTSLAKTSTSASALLPRPTASDVRELYEAVDFHPEEEEREKINENREEEAEIPSGGGTTTSPSKRSNAVSEGSWLELSVNCLLSEAKLTLKNNDTGLPLAAICLHGLQTEIRLGGGSSGASEKEARGENEEGNSSSTSTPRSAGTVGLTAGVTLTNLYGLDYTSYTSTKSSTTPEGQEESESGIIFFGRGPTNLQDRPQQQQNINNNDGDDPSSTASFNIAPPPRPALRLQYTANASKLDVLVQPLRLRLHPVLLQTFVQFVPHVVQGSYVGSCMAALNALSDASRAAFKAEQLQKLGPPLDLVAKIVDFEMLFVGSTSKIDGGGGVLLRTGAVVLHSVGQAASFASAEPIFKVLDRLRDVLGEGTRAHGELVSAVAVVEQQLVYQHVDFDISALQIMAISPASSSTSSSAAATAPIPAVSSYSPDIEILSNFLLPEQPHGIHSNINPMRHQAPPVAPPLSPTDVVSVLLYPMKLTGNIKSHRLALDFVVPQLLVTLAVDPIRANVQYEDVKLFMDIMATSSPRQVAAAAPSSSESEAAVLPHPHLAGPVQTVVDISLSSIDINYADTGGFASHFTLKKGNINFQSYAPAAAGSGSDGGQVGVKLVLDSLLLEDSSSHPSVACALPAVLSPVYRLGKKVFIESAVVDVLPMTVVGGSKKIDVLLKDAVLDGFNEEPGNFIARNNEKEVTQIYVSITDSMDLHRTAVAVTNVSLGHSTILRILAMIFGPSKKDEESRDQEPEQEYNTHSPIDSDAYTVQTSPPPTLPPAVIKQSEIAIDLHSCRIICRYQDPLPGSNIFVPGQVQDYFFVLKDMFIIELPRMSLNLPFLLEEESVDQIGTLRSGNGNNSNSRSVPVLTLEKAELIMATTGVPGYYLLPMLHIPSLVVEREITPVAADSSSSLSWCQLLKIDAPVVEVGVHPSHLIIGTLAMQLLQQEFIGLLGGHLGSEGSDTDTSNRVPSLSPSKMGNTGPHQRTAELTTPRQLLDSEASEIFLSPPQGHVSPSANIHVSPASLGVTTLVDTASAHPVQKKTRWRIETAVGHLSLSLLGSLLTSTCLKLEWHNISSSVSTILPPVTAASSSEAANRNGASDSDNFNDAALLAASLTTTGAWSQLSMHVLRPKDTGEMMESFTPFGGMNNGIFSTPQFGFGGGAGGLGPQTGPGSVLSGAGEVDANTKPGLNPLVPSGTPPSQIIPGIASAAGAGMKRQGSSFFASAVDQEEEQETGLDDADADANQSFREREEGEGETANEAQQQDSGTPLVDASLDSASAATPSFTDARSVMLSRFYSSSGGGGGGSIGSRHLSVHESELFEDAASELFLPDGSVIRSPDGRSPRQYKPVLPLDLTSSDFEVDLLVKLVSTHTGATSSTFTSAAAAANVVFTQHAQHTNLALESLNLRVYLHGWQHVVECVQNYEDFQVQAVGRVTEASAGWAHLGELLSGESTTSSAEEEEHKISPTAAAVDAAEEQKEQSHSAVQIRLQANQLTIEAIAAAGRHPADQEGPLHTARTAATHKTANETASSRIVPAGQITLQLSAEIHQGPDGARFMVSVPAALLRVGPIHLDSILDDVSTVSYSSNTNNNSNGNHNLAPGVCLPLAFGPGDPLLGVKNAEITASSETFEFETPGGDVPGALLSATAAAATAGAGVPLRTRRSLDALAISLQHASVWAGQRNLCSAAALGQHVAYMVAEITSLQNALASQQQHSHKQHNHNHHHRPQSQPQHQQYYKHQRFNVEPSDGIPLATTNNVSSTFDGVIATDIGVLGAAAAAAGDTIYGQTCGMSEEAVVPCTEHHTAINVDIESIAIALQCERLEESRNTENSGVTTSTSATTTGTATATREASPSPLFELALSKISIQSTDRGDGGSSGIAMLQIELDVFNGSKMAWEPVIDPWGTCLHFTIPRLSSPTSSTSSRNTKTGGAGGVGGLYTSPRRERNSATTKYLASSSTLDGGGHLKLEVVSNQNFEATVTTAVTDAAAAAGAILSHIPAVIAEPDTLQEHILPDNSIAAAASLPVTFQLNNLTGSEVEIWLEAPFPGGNLPSRLPSGPPAMCLSPSGRAVLPVLPLYQGSAWRSRRAGKPSFSQGVEFDSNGLGTMAEEGEIDGENTTAADATLRQRRTLLYFRFAGQHGPLSGPVFLDKPGAVSYSVHVGDLQHPQVSSLLSEAAAKASESGSLSSSSFPSPLAAAVSAHVVAETAERRHGSFTAVLHSGVCISNTTPIDLDIGITQVTSVVDAGSVAALASGSGGATASTLNETPSSLGVLPSGESTWLPAPHATAGLLHVRPTASYRPAVVERLPQSARQLPPLPTRHPSTAAVAAAVATGGGVTGLGIGLSSGVQPSSVSSGSSGVVYRSGAGSTLANRMTQTHSPAGTGAAGTGPNNATQGHAFGWSAGLSLSQLIKQQGSSGAAGAVVGDGEGSRHGGVSASVRHLSCAPILSSNLGDTAGPMLLTVGATLQGMSWNLSFAPPFTVHNALPVPVDIIITPKRPSSSTPPSLSISSSFSTYPLRLHLLPNDRAPMLHLNAAHVENVSVRPEGFEMTSPLPINEKSKFHYGQHDSSSAAGQGAPSASEADLAGAWQFHSYSGIGAGSSSQSGEDDTGSISLAGLLLDAGSTGGGGTVSGENPQQLLIPLGAETVATVQELPPGRSTVDVSIQHALNVTTGSHLVRLSCGMWVYNCIGIPISIRNASLEDSLIAEAVAHHGLGLDTSEQDLIMLSIDDHVPDSWVPPLLMPPDVLSSSSNGLDGIATYYGEYSGDASLLRRTGTAVSPLSTYRSTGVGGTGGQEVHQTPRPMSARASGLTSARTAPPGGLTGRSLASISGSMMSVGRTASNADVPGLSEILDSGSGGFGGPGYSCARPVGMTPSPLGTSRGSVLGYQQRPLSRARGIADSMDSSPTFERPSAWPSMASGLSHGAHRLRLQLRSAATKAPPGRTFWSSTVDLDTSGGAVVTSIPSPTPAAAVAAAATGTTPSASALRGSYPIVVTSTQVPSADGVLALCISPQFVLRNVLDMPIQYKQQGSIAGEREVPPGGVRAIRWADDSLPPRLCVRVQEAGWIWSGGFQLDVPGDIFVKSRHRDRGITMLLRVDVAISDSGSAQITLSHNPAGFAPYRVENCSTETLHARQKSVREQQDVLRPYCALNYAWDEPTQPHILSLELPGARTLGNFDLDKVGQDRIISLSNTDKGPLRVVVRAEGPTRVVTVIDEKFHVMRPLSNTAAGQGTTPPATTAAALMAKQQQQSQLSITQHPAGPDLSLSGPIWEIIVDLSSVGVSLVSATHEVAYLRLTGTRVTVAAGAARHSLGFTVKGIQLDNPSPWVAFPVTLVLPAPVSRLGSSMAAAVEMTPAPALQILVSLWQRRPAGVLCVEIAQFQMPSVAVYLDQQHLEEVAAVVSTVMQGPGDGTPTATPTATGRAYSIGEGVASPSSVHATKASSMSLQQPDSVLGSGGGVDKIGTEASDKKDAVNSSCGAGTRVTSSVDLDVLTTTAPESLATSGRQTPALVLGEGLAESNNNNQTSATSQLFPTMPRLPLQNLAALQAAAAATATPRRVDSTPLATARKTTADPATFTTPHGGYSVATVLAPAAAAMALQGITTEANSSSWHRQKIYMDTLSIAPIEVTLSFLSSPVHHYVAAHPRLAALQRLLSLADVEDARVWLAGLTWANPYMDAEALGQKLHRHYFVSLLPELYKLVGAASVIGDPVSLFQHLGAGVWTFVSAPAEGLLASARALGPRQFLLGVLRGTQGLLLNVVFAISNATTKAAGAARKAIVVWGLDRQDEPLGAGSFRRRVMFTEGGGLRRGYDGESEDSLLSAVLRGLAGLISEPIRGVEEAGLVGLVKGLQRGALRAVALPLAVLLEMSARFADSVRRAVAGSSNLGWLRPPRHVSPSEALAPYDWSSAMGRWLLTELQTVEAHSAARRREKMAANHHDHHYHLHHGHLSGRSSVASNAGSGSLGSGSLGSASSLRDDYGSGSGSTFNTGGASMSLNGSGTTSSLSPSAHSSIHTPSLLDVETFLLCVPTGGATTPVAGSQKHNACYLVLTSKRVLYVRAKGLMWEPDVQWQGSMCDLELVSHVAGENDVRFVAHPPPMKVAAPLSLLSSAGSGGGSTGRKTSQAMFSFLRVDCENAEIAEKVKNVTQKAMKAAVPRGGRI